MTNQKLLLDWTNTVAVDTRSISNVGYCTVGAFMLIFGLWATMFPLASAVVAMGSVIPIGKSKAVQHPTGGTVTEIHVEDGQAVKPGDAIITLDPIVDQAELGRLQSSYAMLHATEARLVAQYAGHKTIRFPDNFFDTTINSAAGLSKPLFQIRYNQLMLDQQSEFDANRQVLTRELSELDQQISSSRGQLKNLSSQKNNLFQEKSNLNNQLQRIQPLLAEGYYSRMDADELKRQLLRLSADLDRVTSEITSLKFRISEVKDRKAATIAARHASTSNELSEARSEMDSVKNQIEAAVDTLKKRKIRATADGILTKSAIHTIGGVIAPGAVIAEIVPAGGYKIEARIALKDIDYVKIGQAARVVVTAFDRRLNDPIPATVDYVAADSEFDENTGEQFFVTRLVLVASPDVSNQLDSLRAGMESEVYITTGERTFLNYVMKPLTDGFRRAFREN